MAQGNGYHEDQADGLEPMPHRLAPQQSDYFNRNYAMLKGSVPDPIGTSPFKAQPRGRHPYEGLLHQFQDSTPMIKQGFQPQMPADEIHEHRSSALNFANLQPNLGLSPNPLLLKPRGRADSQINFQHEQFASPNMNNVPAAEPNLDAMLADN